MATNSTYRSEIFRAGVMSALFSLFRSKQKRAKAKGEKYLLQDMAQAAGVTKSQASRWFSFNTVPNWQLSTLYQVCDALGADVDVRIVARETGEVHSASGTSVPIFQTGQSFVSGTNGMIGDTVVIGATGWRHVGTVSYDPTGVASTGFVYPKVLGYTQMAAA